MHRQVRNEDNWENKQIKQVNTKFFIKTPFISDIRNDSAIYSTLKENDVLLSGLQNKNVSPEYLFPDGSNIFGIDKDTLMENLTDITTHIFNVDRDRFVVGEKPNEKFHIDCLLDFLDYVCKKLNLDLNQFTPDNINNEKSKEYCCVTLVAYILTLRILHEARNNQVLKCPSVAEEKAINDWMRISKYRSTVKEFSELKMTNNTGKHAADLFTRDLRNKAAVLKAKGKSNHYTQSLYDIYEGDKPDELANMIRGLLRGTYKKAIKNKRQGENLMFPIIDTHSIMTRVRMNKQVGQFPPVLVHDVISLLKHQYQFEFPKTQNNTANGAMLDPFSGWGARLIAALSHSDIAHYTGVDANPELPPCYKDIYDKYDPEHKKSVHIIGKKLEEVTKAEFQLQKGQTYQFIMTSPPYGVEYYYKGETFYGDPSEITKLFKAIIYSSETLEVNGIMVINLGIIGTLKKPVRNLVTMFEKLITVDTGLSLIRESYRISSKGKTNDNGKEFLIFAKRFANKGSINPLIFPSNSYEFHVNGMIESLIDKLCTVKLINENNKHYELGLTLAETDNKIIQKIDSLVRQLNSIKINTNLNNLNQFLVKMDKIVNKYWKQRNQSNFLLAPVLDDPMDVSVSRDDKEKNAESSVRILKRPHSADNNESDFASNNKRQKCSHKFFSFIASNSEPENDSRSPSISMNPMLEKGSKN